MPQTTVACVQMDCRLGEPEENRRRIVTHIRDAAARGAELVVFPECAVTGYCFESAAEAARFAEAADGETAGAVSRACAETGAHAVVGFIEASGGKLYNAALVAGPRGPVGVYRKVHLPFIGADRFTTPGEGPFRVFDLPFGRVGVNICYDASFPESARVLKLLGAELVVLPTNWPPEAWRTPAFVLNTRAQENHVNYVACDRVGGERGYRFIGRSRAVDFNGDTVAEAGEGEEVVFARLDLAGASVNRIVNAPGAYEIDRIADRRPECYGPIAARSDAAKAT